MAPIKAYALSSATISLALTRYLPRLAMGLSTVWLGASFFGAQLLAYFIWTVIIYPKFFSPLRHLPQPKGGSFLNGHFWRIMREATGQPLVEFMENVPNDGLILYHHALNAERLLVSSPKAISEVLVQKSYEFVKPEQVRGQLGRILGVGILLAEGDEHKRQRKLLMPAFAYRHIKDLYPVFWSKAKEVARKMSEAVQTPSPNIEKPANVLEVGSWASRVALDIVGVAGMGKDFNAVQNPNNDLYTTYQKIFSPTNVARVMAALSFFLPQWLLRRLPVERNDQIREAVKIITRTCYDLLQAKRQQLEKGGDIGLDIISVALKSGGFSDEELVNQLMTFLAAGHETTASSMTWAAYCFAKHPAVQSRLREEIRAKLPSISSDSSETITAAMIDDLPYLNAFCREVLRLYSPVPITLRMAANDSSILGQYIPKGTTIILCPWAINTSKVLWGSDAKEFNPDRWMGPGRANSGGATSNFDFMTFLHGPRSCIGMQFALAEFKCLVAAWMGTFEMELDPGYVLDIKGGITMKPRGGLPLKMKVVEGW